MEMSLPDRDPCVLPGAPHGTARLAEGQVTSALPSPSPSLPFSPCSPITGGTAHARGQAEAGPGRHSGTHAGERATPAAGGAILTVTGLRRGAARRAQGALRGE